MSGLGVLAHSHTATQSVCPAATLRPLLLLDGAGDQGRDHSKPLKRQFAIKEVLIPDSTLSHHAFVVSEV